ncbi:MAG: cell surface polysaccharide biosynthesis protein [Pyrinomonadaceae bacterium]|nr:MAG: cell surface polysaccharide biosynthesis protein [Pyrinomonadaceae bacterium]
MITQMVDLKNQYEKIKDEIDKAILECVSSTAYINGPAVETFSRNLEKYLSVKHVIPCANGTDALQIALMALDLEPGDEVIVPAFTFISTAEVVALLRLRPVMVDVDFETFNVTAENIEKAITPRTKVIMPVHLFGQACDMQSIMELAEKYGLYVIEDNAQSIGAECIFSDGTRKKAGTIGHIGTTSFFPSKNLGCYGDGGAIFTNDDLLAEKMRMIANHGQSKRYYHDYIGVNSRLDSIQAAILNVKLKYLDQYCMARRQAASFYDEAFSQIEEIQIPARAPYSTHVFHQYTLKVPSDKRDRLIEYLNAHGIPAMIYYPIPLNRQKAFAEFVSPDLNLPVTEKLCSSVVSLPMHTELSEDILRTITERVKRFFTT